MRVSAPRVVLLRGSKRATSPRKDASTVFSELRVLLAVGYARRIERLPFQSNEAVEVEV